MLPSGWSYKSLADAGVKVLDGDRGHEYPNEADFSDSGYCLFLSAKNVTKSGFKFDEVQFINEEKHKKLRKGIVEKGDIVLTTRGTVGNFSIFDSSVPYEIIRINSGMVVLKALSSEISPEYLYSLSKSFSIEKQIKLVAFGSAQPQLTVPLIKGLMALIPPLPEQKQIAQILSTWDKAITTTEQLIANSQQQKKALMQQLLTGKKRLLDENGVRFSGEWETRTLGEIGEIKSAGVDKNVVDGEVPVRLLNFTDVFRRDFVFSHELNHWVTAPESKVKNCDVRKGDVFFTPSSETRDEIGMATVIAEDIPDCCYSYHIIRFRIKENWDLNFKAYAFGTDEFKRQAYKLGDGSGQRYVISQDGFRSISVTYPRIKEQQAIGRVLLSAEQTIQSLKLKLNHLKQEKKALMQQLLTGKRRVKVD